jgi:peroxiredoxin
MTTSVRTAGLSAPLSDQTIRQQLDGSAIWNRMVAAGDRLPDLPLVEADLGPIHLNRLRQTGPVVLVFFRHTNSPACESALCAYRDLLAPRLEEFNAHLVAVSPQAPARLQAVKRRHDLGFLVASDGRHTLIDIFNIGFRSPGADVALGTGRSVLPFAAIVAADRTGVIRFADVRADWATITDPGRVTAAIRAMR